MPHTGDEPPKLRARRPLLADAAIAVLAREGGRGLTHRAVDRQAGVPEGTTKNYWPTRQAILAAAASRMAEQHQAAVDQLRATTPAGATPYQLRMLYPALVRRAAQDPTQALAMVELYLEAVRVPEVRVALADMAAANATATAELHQAAGVPSDPAATGLLDACLLGVLLARAALPADTLAATGLADTDTVGTRVFDTTVRPAPVPRDHPVLSLVCHPSPRAGTRRQPVTYGHGR
jgi:DNA-binding transcriptional regulator YbjK